VPHGILQVFINVLGENVFQNPQMGCPALGIWVGFLKQPALPGKVPTKKILQKKF
jgi:hypothetical protein